MTRTNEAGETRAGAAAPNADTHKSDAQPVYPHTMRLQRFWRARAWRAAAVLRT